MEGQMTQVKICGIKRLEDVEYVNECLPEYIGFVFLEGRKRFVSPALARELRAKLDPRIQAVGVFVDAPAKLVISLLKEGTIQLAQLHGHEDASYVKQVKEACDKPIIKAFVIRTEEDVEKALAFESDYLLLDGGLGYGETFDWSLITGLKQRTDKKFFLAGGLTADNVQDAIKQVEPFAVDVSSAVETEDLKDFEKIKQFINRVRHNKKG